MAYKGFKAIKACWRNFAYCSLGFVSLLGFIIAVFLCLPIFLYRWIICQVLGPLCGRDLGKAVTVASSVFTTDLKNDKVPSKPRSAIVVNIVFDGSIKFEYLADQVNKNWICAMEPNTGGLKYPEFQQFVERWMGYFFWKQDKSFSLENHLVHHKCKGNWTEMKCEAYASSISEELLNKPFPLDRSPWEVHMISNFRNSETQNNGMEMTLIIFRFHHCLADGYGVLAALVEGLLNIPFSKCGVVTASKLKSSSDSPETSSCFSQKIYNFVSFPIKVTRDIGWAAYLSAIPVRTPWYLPEDKCTGHQLYAKSSKLPVSKLRAVKNTFGVSFTATILSSIAAGIASFNKSKGVSNHLKELPFGSPLPMNDHPDKLRNHVTIALYEIPIDQTISPLERLRQSEKYYQKAKQSTFPLLMPFVTKFAAAQLPIISRFLVANRTISSFITNFPGPGAVLNAAGADILEMDFGTGLVQGVSGVGFMVLSYVDHMRISVVAENAALERHELLELVTAISDEIDTLHKLAHDHDQQDKDVKINMTDQQ